MALALRINLFSKGAVNFVLHTSTTPTGNSTRPPFDPSNPIKIIQPPTPTWTLGDGATQNNNERKNHISINPHSPTRPPSKNYQFLISSIIPRPIALISTKSNDMLNLAPFSYFQVINHDPPMFVVSFTPTNPDKGGKKEKDTLRNLKETGECVINLVSEDILQAANATSINSQYGESEFEISGLTPLFGLETVCVPRVKEAIVSIEGRLLETKEIKSRANPDRNGVTTLAIIEGTRFWVREDAIDSEEQSVVDVNVLRPVSRLGGNTYGRVTEVVEIKRPVDRS
ncbi:conserved hypothetical protein [Talaromyces stipitatus ATCC 10500]|uniref:Flavin reductase like domain-containing protein n=1 Tax=Talaromyces stipitatus (strain ATCC 10500 / CBS 375.48 / QM 6759 / NRRL 1006) TaxID=441959 RepID=B8M0H9_TALSN|nr:uncharacterized protein TSTA_085070 [Talaromyces stipitatus ATCC 10500]EED21276.1 conserved hypothetical protein [Talaromyces stipitatus ATCC 10500]